ncbi:MAG: leucine-rich repeat domain-containing protein [Bacteroidota bacterium]|nr:leucine-rich repeat domain-containing protein [Candidatus Kapabacteria bacterium]MDW8220719.1 leucine-rich repeat domain-containing protein [Bacteroidota bacterium]
MNNQLLMRILLLYAIVFLSTVLLPLHAQEASILDDKALEKEKEYTSLDEALKNPQKVYKLDLSHSGLVEFPLEILKLPNLQRLNLSHNGLESIPPSIAQLTKLQHLNLSTNGLKKLPAEIAGLKHLKSLDISQNQFVASELNRVKSTLPHTAIID